VDRGITFKKVWADDDVVELEIAICDGASSFRSRVYAAHTILESAVTELEAFKRQNVE